MENYQNCEYNGIKLFKHFELNDNVLAYQTYREKKLRRIRTKNQAELIDWVENKLVANMKMQIDVLEDWDKINITHFNNLNIGDVVYWREGYGCTLYQFGKVIKKTAKTVTYQKYSYRGMDSRLKLKDLALIDETFTLSYKKAKTCLYDEVTEATGGYDNNSD